MTANPRSLDVELLLLQENRVVHVEPLAGRALFVGRNPDNDLVLTEATCAIWAAPTVPSSTTSG